MKNPYLQRCGRFCSKCEDKKKKNQAACRFSESPCKRTLHIKYFPQQKNVALVCTISAEMVHVCLLQTNEFTCAEQSTSCLKHKKKIFFFWQVSFPIFPLCHWGVSFVTYFLFHSLMFSESQARCYKWSVLHTTMKPRAFPSLHLTNFDPNLSSCHYPSPHAHHLILSHLFLLWYPTPFYLSHLIFLLPIPCILFPLPHPSLSLIIGQWSLFFHPATWNKKWSSLFPILPTEAEEFTLEQELMNNLWMIHKPSSPLGLILLLRFSHLERQEIVCACQCGKWKWWSRNWRKKNIDGV